MAMSPEDKQKAQDSAQYEKNKIAQLQEWQRQQERDGRIGGGHAVDGMIKEAQDAYDMKMSVINQQEAADAGPATTEFYGGTPGLEKGEIDRAHGAADAYANRAAPTTDYTLADQDRGEQSQAIGLMRDAAMGQAPSVAAIQQQQGLDQAMGMNSSMAASARGGGNSQALAARSALSNNADMQQRGVADAAMLRAQEMAQARGAYGQMGMNMGTQDIGRGQYESTLAQNQMFGNDRAVATAEDRALGVERAGDAQRLGHEGNMISATTGANTTNAGTATHNATAADEENQRHDARTGAALTAGGQALGSVDFSGGPKPKGNPSGLPMGYDKMTATDPNLPPKYRAGNFN